MVNIVEFLKEKYPLIATYNQVMEKLIADCFEDEISEDEFLKGYKKDEFLNEVLNNSMELSTEVGVPIHLEKIKYALKISTSIEGITHLYNDLAKQNIIYNEDLEQYMVIEPIGTWYV